jgi:transposase-like protein
MGSKKYHDADWLREKYHVEQDTMKEIAERCGVTSTTIGDWMDRHGIQKRDQSEAQLPEGKHTDREWLAEQYNGEGRTLADIGEECGVTAATVLKWMRKHDIPRRGETDHFRVSRMTKRTLERGYVQYKCRTPDGTARVYGHQLAALAAGHDPEKIFSNGEYQCHHRNGIRWDNRPENVELLTDTEHADEHWPTRERADTGEFL